MFIKIIAYLAVGVLLMHLSPAVAANDTVSLARIVGGSSVNIANVPYLMQMWLGQKFVCGATLVSKLFVVTAAHCVSGVKPSALTIVGGATTLSETGVRRKVAKIIVSPQFSWKTMTNDVAVLKLAKAMQGPKIKPIALNTQPVTTGLKMKVSGWGLRSETSKQASKRARTISVPVVDKAKCTTQYRSINRLSSTMFCAAKPGVKDACSGDSGGPAVCRGKLCGIVSWGAGCARRNYPGVYTGTLAVRSFILNAMKQ